jgi:PAS domain S-box-containing protein
MRDQRKTKKQLINELVELRQLVGKLQEPEIEDKLEELDAGEAEERYRTLVDLSPDPVAILQGDRYQFVNPAFTEVFGYTQQEVDNSLSFYELVQEKDKEAVRRQYEDRLAGNKVPKNFCIDLIARDGTVIPCESSATLIEHKGRPADLVFIRDITERKRAEDSLRRAHEELEQKVEERTNDLLEANTQLKEEIKNRKRVEKRLRKSEAYIKGILKAAPIGIGLVQDRVVRWTNERMSKMLGYSENELVGQSARIAYESDEEFQRVGQVKYAEIQQGGSGAVETRLKRKDGGVFDVLVCSSAIDTAELSEGTIFTALDITARKRAEEALRESEYYFRSLLFNMHEDILVIDRDYRVTDVNNALLVTAGLKYEDVIGRHCYEVSHGYNEPCERKGEECILPEVFETGEPGNCRHQHERADGSKVWVDILLSPLREKSGKVTHVIEAIRDVSDLVQMEEVLREREANFRALAENANDGILIAAGEGGHVYANRRAAEITGYSVSELVQIGLRELVASDEVQKIADRFMRRLSGENVPSQYETAFVKKSGEIFPVELSSARSSWKGEPATIVIVRDITKRKRGEAQLLSKSRYLEEVNAALKVLLKKRDEDKEELGEKVISNVKQLISPYLEKLKKSHLGAHQATLVEILESNVKEIVSPFVTKLSSRFLSLTPKEIQIATLIKDGKSNKEIASVMHLSVNTVRSHRHHIRTKLGLTSQKMNLRSYLQSLQ